MAGGLERLRPLTYDMPKPLIKIGGRPILETIIRSFANSGFSNFFLAVNYRKEMIEDYFGDGSKCGACDPLPPRTRQCARVRPARCRCCLGAAFTRPIIVMNGDLVTRVNFRQVLNYHIEHAASATVCVREYKVTVPFGVVTTEDHHLLDIKEKPTFHHFVNAGVYVLDPATLSLVQAEGALDMPDLLQRLAAAGRRPAVFPLSEYWMDVGHLDDLRRASLDYEEIFGK